MFRNIKYSLILLLCSLGFSKGQLTSHTILSAGYTYQNQSFGDLGIKMIFLENDDFLYRIGASAMIGSTNGEFAILPKLHTDLLFNTQKNVDLFHSHYFIVGAETTTKYIAPRVGVSILGLLDLTAGYALSIDKSGINNKELKGLNINIGLHLPISLLRD